MLHTRAENPKDNEIEFVAKDTNTIIGYIRLTMYDDHIDWLSLYVSSKYFGDGVGTALWEEAQKQLPSGRPIMVEVATYTKAVEFYKKLGFVDTSERSYENIMEIIKTAMPLMKLVLLRA
jgi:ribosomal protein S18 acetylase RimI-like enzyme